MLMDDKGILHACYLIFYSSETESDEMTQYTLVTFNKDELN